MAPFQEEGLHRDQEIALGGNHREAARVVDLQIPEADLLETGRAHLAAVRAALHPDPVSTGRTAQSSGARPKGVDQFETIDVSNK